MFEFAESAWQRLTGLEPFPEPPFIKIRYPVVLMHGFGLFASMRRGGHLHQEALNLRAHGVPAYAPNVSAYNTVAVRSESWKRRIERVLEETGADRVNLIAQSMGGLDARYLVSELGMHSVVASVVTVSSPHHGSGVANLVLERPESVRRWLAGIFDWMGSAALADATSDFLTSVRELTPDHIATAFNPGVLDHPSVRYYSYAGVAGKGTDVPINPFLEVLNRALYKREGLNDGFVSVESAQWGEFLGTIEADHVQQVGLSLLSRTDFDSGEFYCDVVRHVAADGF